MPPGSLLMATAAVATAAVLCVFAKAASAAVAVDAADQVQVSDPAPYPPSAQASDSSPQEAPVVAVTQGRMRGSVLQSRGGRPIYAFRAIPYAKPPVGALRFQEPVAASAWDGVLDATDDAPQCVQKNYLMPPSYPVSGSEDCLFLNVYTPKLMASARLPVIVYIHGGGFFAGSGASYFNGPQFLLDHDVVLVTINYRLGALGFLSSGDERAPGNAGLKDQTMALRWVRDNVEALGGDPNLVTIMGQSAGGASVHYHMLSPLSKGLFHRAISQSGTTLSKWAEPLDPLPILMKQAEYLGCNALSADDALLCLRNADANNLTETSINFKFWDIDPLVVFRPVVEARRPGAFLVENPVAIMRMGDFSHVPWLSGSVTDEGIIRALPILSNKYLSDDLNTRWDEIMPRLMELETSTSPDNILDIWRNISSHYFGETLPHIHISNPQPFIDLYSDRAFLQGFQRSAELHARAGHKSIFLYEMAYRGSFSYSTLFGGGLTDYGVSHCDDLLYLLYAPVLFPNMPEPGSTDEQMLNMFTQMWVNFAKYGHPTPTRTEKTRRASSRVGSSAAKATSLNPDGASQDGVTQCWTNAADTYWEPYEPSVRANDMDLRFLRIDAATSCKQNGCSKNLRTCMRKGFHRDRLDFWRSLPLNENKVNSLELLLLPFFYLVSIMF